MCVCVCVQSEAVLDMVENHRYCLSIDSIWKTEFIHLFLHGFAIYLFKNSHLSKLSSTYRSQVTFLTIKL